jgi:hypothetical protein
MLIKNTIQIIDDMLHFGIYKDNLETLINKCNKINNCVIKENILCKQHFYNLIADLEQNSINLTEDDLYITENIINIKTFLLTCN